MDIMQGMRDKVEKLINDRILKREAAANMNESSNGTESKLTVEQPDSLKQLVKDSTILNVGSEATMATSDQPDAAKRTSPTYESALRLSNSCLLKESSEVLNVVHSIESIGL